MKRWFIGIFALAQSVLAAGAIAEEARLAGVIVFDSSNSMWTQIEGTNKVFTLRESLARIFEKLAPQLDLGIMTYGHKEANSCNQVEELVPVASNDAQSLSAAVTGVNPAKGATPLSVALERAATAHGIDGMGDVVLISDGVDNCRRDVCQAARQLHADYGALRIHVIGFGLSAKRELKDLNCVADATGGSFYLASNKSELDGALQGVAAIMTTARTSEPPVLGNFGGTDNPADDITAATDSQVEAPEQTIAQQSAPDAGVSEIQQGTDSPVPPSRATAPADAIRQIQSQVDREDAHGAGTLRLSATLTKDSPMLHDGLIWRVFASKPDADGTYKVVARSEEGNPVFELASGTYVVHLGYGRANATRDITIEGGKPRDEIVNLDAGGLRLRAELPGGRSIPDNLISYAIYSPEQDQLGDRRLVMPSAEPGKIIRLNAGNYYVVSQYGDANAVVRANVAVQAGRLSEATVKHSAAKITLKLVNEPGGEALANTSWSILTADGAVVAESVGAFPTHILAAGTYSVLARHEGQGYNREFTVQAGLDQEVELVATQ